MGGRPDRRLDRLKMNRGVDMAVLIVSLSVATAGVGHFMLGILYPNAGPFRRREHHTLQREHCIRGTPDVGKVDKRHRTAAFRIHSVARKTRKTKTQKYKKKQKN